MTILCRFINIIGYPIVPLKKDQDTTKEPPAFTGQGVSLRAAKKKP